MGMDRVHPGLGDVAAGGACLCRWHGGRSEAGLMWDEKGVSGAQVTWQRVACLCGWHGGRSEASVM